MLDDMRKFVAEQVMSANEASVYLGISTQRLNQLVHADKIIPVKISKAGMLFLKEDLDERKKDLEELGTDLIISKVASNMSVDNIDKILQEALNYFSIQAFFGYSDKRTVVVFSNLGTFVDTSEPLNWTEVSIILKIDKGELEKSYEKTVRSFGKLAETDLIVKRGQALYPELLAKTKEAPPFLFMRGNIEIVHQSIVAVVGSRQPSEDGAKKASILASLLGKHRIVVASGLARGIDTAAHLGALNNGFLTITVIGTPLSKVYPKENAYLQKLIGEKGLVISQFPPSAEVQRWNFPMRNAIMSGISLATVVVEAGETSGALKQADYALKQGRIVFIPQSAIENPKLKWPRNYMKRPGAKNFSKIDELIIELENSKVITNEKTKEKATTQVTLFDEETGTHYAN